MGNKIRLMFKLIYKNVRKANKNFKGQKKTKIQISAYREDKNKKAIQHAHNKNKTKQIQKKKMPNAICQ